MSKYSTTKQNDNMRRVRNEAIKQGITGLELVSLMSQVAHESADFKITDSLLYTNNNNLILDALISINIKDFNEVYKIFQTPRSNRKEIKKIEFNLSYNFDQRTANLNGIKVDDLINEKVNKTLNQIILKDKNLQNKIYLKNLLNQAIKSYVG